VEKELSSSRKKPLCAWILIYLTGFLSLSGLAGGYGFIIDPSGKEVGFPPETIHKLPFPDYLIPGLFLFLVYGCWGGLITYGLIKPGAWRWANLLRLSSTQVPVWSMAIELGIVMLIWIIVQVYFMYPPLAALQIIYFILGLLISGGALLPTVRKYYTSFQ
jgi:hypothetical protein